MPAVTRTLWLSMLLLSIAGAVVGCDPPPTAIPPGEPQPVSATPPPRPAPVPARPIETVADAAPVAPSETGTGGAVGTTGGAVGKTGGAVGTTGGAVGKTGGAGPAVTPKALAAVGAACDSAADCETGICEGEGCAPGRGRCAAKNRSCTRDRRPYCGCDGNTFYSSGSCPGRRFASRGACGAGGSGGAGAAAKLAADGATCHAAADCQSGICEGEGCGDGTPGTCKSRKRPCTADLRPFCGCDGVTFRGSSSCPGRRYAARGDCKK